MGYYLICKGKFLCFSAFFEAALHNAAAVFVGAYLYTINDTSLEDKLSKEFKALTTLNIGFFRILRSFEDAQKGLDYMVSMGVLDKYSMKN